MKQILFIATFIVGLSSLVAQATESIGLVAAIKGNVYAIENGQKTPLAVKSKVYENQTLVSVGESTAQLLFKDQSIFTLGHNTEIVLDKFIYDTASAEGESVINVTKGFFRFITGKIAKKHPEQVKVTTPFATIGVRGSGGIGQVLPTGQTTVGLTVCCLDVSNGQGSVPLDRPNFFTEINSPSAAPTEPKPFANDQLAELNRALSTEAEEAATEEQEATETENTGAEGDAEGAKPEPTDQNAPKEGEEPAPKEGDEKPAKKKAETKLAPKFADAGLVAPEQGDAPVAGDAPAQPLAPLPLVDTTLASQDTAENQQTGVAGIFRRGTTGAASYLAVNPIEGRLSKDGSMGLRLVQANGTYQEVFIPADSKLNDVIKIGAQTFTIVDLSRTADSFFYVELASGSQSASMLVGQKLTTLPTSGHAYYQLKNDILKTDNELTTAVVSFDGKKMLGGSFDAATGTYSVGFANMTSSGIFGEIRNNDGIQTFNSIAGQDTFGINQLDAFQIKVNNAAGTQQETNVAVKAAGNARVEQSINRFNSRVDLQGFLGGFIKEGSTAPSGSDIKNVSGNVAITLDKSSSRAFAKLDAFTETGEGYAASFGTNANSAALGTLAYATAQDSSVKHLSADMAVVRSQGTNNVYLFNRKDDNITAQELGIGSLGSVIALSGDLAVVSKPVDTSTAAEFEIYKKTGNTWAAVQNLDITGALSILSGSLTEGANSTYYGNNSVFIDGSDVYVAVPSTSESGTLHIGSIIKFNSLGLKQAVYTVPADNYQHFGADFTVQNGKLYSYSKADGGSLIIADLSTLSNNTNVISTTTQIQNLGNNPTAVTIEGNESFVIVQTKTSEGSFTTIVDAQTNQELQRITLANTVLTNISLYGNSYAQLDAGNSDVYIYTFDAQQQKFVRKQTINFEGISDIELTSDGLYFTQSNGGDDKLYLVGFNGDGTLSANAQQVSGFTAAAGTTADITADQGQFAMANQQAVLSNFGLENVGCTTCQFVHWGLWNGNFENEGATDGTALADMVAYVAGTNMQTASQLDVLSAQNVTASYSGALIGSLLNTSTNQTEFNSAGQLNMAVDFNARTVNMNGSTFAGHSFDNSALGWDSGQNKFTGTFDVTGAGVGSGSATGAFFGAGAAETGGNFQFTTTNSQASGIFIGKQ